MTGLGNSSDGMEPVVVTTIPAGDGAWCVTSDLIEEDGVFVAARYYIAYEYPYGQIGAWSKQATLRDAKASLLRSANIKLMMGDTVTVSDDHTEYLAMRRVR